MCAGLGDGLTDAAAAKGPAGEAGPSKPEEDGTAEAATESPAVKPLSAYL